MSRKTHYWKTQTFEGLGQNMKLSISTILMTANDCLGNFSSNTIHTILTGSILAYHV